MSAKDLGPLDWRVPIVTKDGAPTPEFQRRWNTQRANNGLIGTVTFGSGAPTGAPGDGAEYVNVSATPMVLYMGQGGAWHKLGPTSFLELTDAPHSYSAAGTKLVRVNAGASGLEFVTQSAALDTIGSTRGAVLYRGAAGWVLLAPGTAGQVLQTQGAGADPQWAAGGGGSGGLLGPPRVITSGSGTYTPTPGATSIVVILVGGGGGGGGCAAGGGSAALGRGGQGGGTLQVRLTSGFAGATYAVGTKGTGGAAGNTAGTDGGDTTFTTTTPTTYTAKGGKNQGAGTGPFGYPWVAVPSGSLNVTTGGDWSVSGGQPAPCQAPSHFNCFAGNGGTSLYSPGQAYPGLTTPGYGGGGAGGVSDQTSAQPGGDGSAGVIFIYEYG